MNKLNKIFLVIIIILIISLTTMIVFFFNMKKQVDLIYSVYKGTLDKVELLEMELQEERNQNSSEE